MDSWPEQLATAIAQIQQKQLLQQTAGLRTSGAASRLGAARNSIAVGRSSAEETLINKMAQAAAQGLNPVGHPFHQLAATEPCCAARKASICAGEIQLGNYAFHQLHAFPSTAEQQQAFQAGTLLQQQQEQSAGRSFERQPNYLHPNDAASLAASRPSWSAGNLANANLNVAATNQLNPNANKNNRELLALFVPRAGSLDA